MYTIGYTLDELIGNIPETHIYAYYLGSSFHIGQPMISPLRQQDKSPSFSIFYSRKNNKLMYKDFGTGDSGDCVQFVRNYLSLKTSKEAKLRILNDLNSNTTTSTRSFNFEPIKAQKRTIFVIEEQEYTEVDRRYWANLNVGLKTLQKFDIVSVKKLWVDNEIKWLYSDLNPIFGYKINDTIKCYRPFGGKGNKFRTNCSTEDIQGYKQLPAKGDLLIITKAMKDVVVLYELGYTAIAPHSEGATIPVEIMVDLQSRFNNIIILYDNDEAGISTSNKLATTYNLKQIFIPNQLDCKDISDLVSNLQNIQEVSELLQNLLNNAKHLYATCKSDTCI